MENVNPVRYKDCAVVYAGGELPKDFFFADYLF